MVSMGQQRYIKDTAMPWKEGEFTAAKIDVGETAPGAAIIRQYTGQLTAAIIEALAKVHEGRAGRYAKTIQARLEGVDPEALALIGLRRALLAASDSSPMMSSCMNIGTLVEEHVAITALRTEEKNLANWWERKAAKTSNSQHARKVMRAAARDQLNATAWTKEDRIKVGAFIVELIQDNLGIMEMTSIQRGKRRVEVITCTPTFREWLDSMHAKCALMQPVRLPMIIPPLDWSTPWDGGYLTVDTRLMKNASRGELDDLASADLLEVYAAVNSLQRVPWRINESVLNVLRALRDAPAGAPCIPSGEPSPIPARPATIRQDVAISDLPEDQQKELKAWRAAATQAYEVNAKRLSKRVAFAQKVWVAEEFSGEDAIYFPYQIDTRGRVYTVPTEVSPQSDDLGKALLRFATAKPLGEFGAYWLAVHVANCYGNDKVTFDERVQWVLDNEELILEVGVHGADRVELWAETDSPWQFLAACQEWTGYVVSGRSDDFESSIPIGMDGSCSGLQHFSAALRDDIGGRAVNLMDTGGVEDIYTEVARRVNLCLDSSTCDDDLVVWRGLVDRKIVKQPCMTYAYSATVNGMRGQIVNALAAKPESERPDMDPFVAASRLAPLVRQCIEEVVIAAAGAMKWMQQSAAIMTDAGLDLRWTAANGLPVRQSERKLAERRVAVWYSGRRYQPSLQEDTEVLNKMGQKSAVAPNWVHSQDAAHLMAVVNVGAEYGLTDWAMVHDSFGVHACDVPLLNEVIRVTFVEQYSPDRLAELRDAFLDRLPEDVELPPLPAMGALDLNAVLQSQYFFA